MRAINIKLLILIGLIIMLPAISFAKHTKIFMVQSYSKNDLCGIPQLKGAIDTLREAGFSKGNTNFYTFFMKTKTQYTTKKQIKEIADKAYRKIIKTNPDVVFLFDDAAFMELAPKLIHTHFKVIFSGVNRPLEEYNRNLHFMDKNRYPTANITGVYEKLHVYNGVKFVENIIGKKGKIAILSSNDVVGKIIDRQISLELKNAQFYDELSIYISNKDQLISSLDRINNDKDIVAYILNIQSITDRNRKIGPSDAIKIAVKYAKKPDIAVNNTYSEAGLFGGEAVDFYAMGAQVARLAIRSFNTPIIHLKIEDAIKTSRFINMKRAEQIGIKIPLYILNSLNAVY